MTAPDPTDREVRTVTVAGHGAADGVPDVMHVDLGVECAERTVAEALTAANDALSAVTAVLRAAGVDEADVRTTRLTVHPRYGEHGPDGAPIVGFTASHSLRVTLRDVEEAPRALGSAAQAGGDAVRVEQVAFAVADDADLAAAAREAAYADARTRAEQFAALAGARLGPVLTVDEGAAPTDAPPMYARMAAAAPMPVHAGSHTVTAAVTVRFELI